MKKPKPKAIKRLDFDECVEYISNKLGIELRDVAGKYKHKFGTPEFESTPYQDFWHFVIDNNDIHNGCEIFLPSPDGNIFGDDEQWVIPILEAFWQEFGEGPYWVEW